MLEITEFLYDMISRSWYFYGKPGCDLHNYFGFPIDDSKDPEEIINKWTEDTGFMVVAEDYKDKGSGISEYNTVFTINGTHYALHYYSTLSLNCKNLKELAPHQAFQVEKKTKTIKINYYTDINNFIEPIYEDDDLEEIF